MKLWFWGLVVVTACYRDSGTVEPAAAPMAIAQTPLKCDVDDLAQPVVDSRPGGRLRSHTEGSLARSWHWVGPTIPQHVPPRLGSLELFIADDADRGVLAFYREPYNRNSCQLAGGHRNCAYEARYYDEHGKLGWALELGDILTMPEHLEVQDIRLAGGVLYFNEGCQSYSGQAGGRCSRLVAVDPIAKKVLWRTDPLTSNGRFRVRGCYIVAGYGFTAEPDNLFLVDRATGKILQSIPVTSAPEELTLVGNDRLAVRFYSGNLRSYRLDGFDGAKAKLVDLDPPEHFGGAGYGGHGYGGASYGYAPRRRP